MDILLDQRLYISDTFIEVRIGTALSGSYMVGNGTPQGSVISLILISHMTNDVFSKVQVDIGRPLFADDGALWKGEGIFIILWEKIQEEIHVVQNGYITAVLSSQCKKRNH